MDQKDPPRPRADGWTKSHITGADRVKAIVVRIYTARTDHQSPLKLGFGCSVPHGIKGTEVRAYPRCSPRARHQSKNWRRGPDEDLGTSRQAAAAAVARASAERSAAG